jgi:hypothetical protein
MHSLKRDPYILQKSATFCQLLTSHKDGFIIRKDFEFIVSWQFSLANKERQVFVS